MRITLAQLEAFFWVARLGSVHMAARQLNLAQPTVSLRLRDLEARLGTALFERAGRGLRPTHDGETLVAHAARILDEVAAIGDRGRRDEVSGVARVGVAETFALVALPMLLRVLRQDHPALRLELVVAMSSDLERAVEDHELDLAFVVNPFGNPRLRLIPLGVQQTTWAAAPSWKLGPGISPSELRQVPIISNPHPSAMYRQIAGWFRTAGLEPGRLDSCSSVAVIAQLVVAGVAVGFLPTKMIEQALNDGAVQALSSTPPVERARVYLIHRLADDTNSVQAILQAARKVLSSINFLTTG